MNVFLSTPISCFKSSEELQSYKDSISGLISSLQDTHNICYEIGNINTSQDYDSPEVSVSMDLEQIKKSDVFILHYPFKKPSSALIELGYALALEKRIIIITPNLSTLPFLARGLKGRSQESLIIESEKVDTAVIEKINHFISLPSSHEKINC